MIAVGTIGRVVHAVAVVGEIGNGLLGGVILSLRIDLLLAGGNDRVEMTIPQGSVVRVTLLVTS